MTAVASLAPDRIDGPLKVAGAAPYPSDHTLPNLAHAVLVGATVAAGRITSVEWDDAPGVLAVLTHENTPKLAVPPVTALGPPPRYAFTDDRIVHYGQHVAVVVAETREQAVAAARSVRVEYAATTPVLDLDDPRAEVVRNGWDAEVDLGDTAAALAAAEVAYDETFHIAAEANNPMGLFATLAAWDGGRLLVHDCNQWPMMTRQALAAAFGVPESDVRVLVPYLGGGFGSGLRTWSHTLLTALAAKTVGRPVKLVLSRPQMFTSVGHRAQSRQRLRLGATATAG